MEQPKLILIGGANGSGKTTLARRFVELEQLRYLGADEIARELNPAQPESAAIAAAREFSQRLETAIASHESLIVEATLSGKSLRHSLAQARQQGYELTVAFVYLDSAELCLERIAVRVASGGHAVPEQDVRRRFARANQNFWHTYRQFADHWYLFYNAGDAIRQVAGCEAQRETVIDNERYTQWLKMVTTTH